MKKSTSTLKIKHCLALMCLGAACLLVVPSAHAGTVTITNPDFSTDDSGWNVNLDTGVAGTYNATTNPYGSTAILYAHAGGPTGTGGAPVMTAGQLDMDSGQVTDPGAPYPTDLIVNHFGTDVRDESSNGQLGSYSQNTGTIFLPGTVYTFSAYVFGQSTGPDYMGVGLSGNSALTLSQVASNTDGFTTSTPHFTDLVKMGASNQSSFMEETLTLDTADHQSLVGQNIVVNLLSNNTTYYGRGQYFTDASLTYSADVPEPSTYVLAGLGFLGLVLLGRRRLAS